MNESELKKLSRKIEILKKDAIDVQKLSGGIMAVECNVGRVLASIKMLEINITDAVDIYDIS